MSREEFLNQESAGGIANFVLTVDQAWFAPDADYTAKSGVDVHFLHWAGRTDLPDRPLMGEGDYHPKWSLDPDFVSTDGGTTVVSQSGRKQKVGKGYGRMCTQAAKVTAHLAGTPEDFLDSADPKDARIWIGTQWRLDNVSYDYGGNIGKREELMPVEYLGRVQAPTGVAGAPVTQFTPPPAQMPATAPQPAPVAAQAVAPAPAPQNGVRGQVEALAASAADYRTFQQAALSIPGVAEDTALVNEVLDQGPGGLYARVRG